ncbi:MAG: hypothetical protein JSS60_08210 [Verrucomicrobia bacterium]|nr:hypothetical protein [Verrucomicrobiota bacterium]
MILLSLLLLCAATPSSPESSVSKFNVEIASQPSTTTPGWHEKLEPAFHSLFDSTLYLGAGTVFGSATLLSGIGWSLSQLTPWASTIGKECFLSSRIFGIATIHSFAQGFKKSPLFSFLFKQMPSSHSSWERNNQLLSEIPVDSQEDKELLDFLQRRWLAKTTGCYPFLVDWMCSSFGISLQMHPESTNSYARDPANKPSDTYKNRIEAWKKSLPHPQDFPLILTRPSRIADYLPVCFEALEEETIQRSVERLAQIIETAHFPVVVDLSAVLPRNTSDRKQWLDAWQCYEQEFAKCCHRSGLDMDQFLCVQRVEQREIGGMRLLPLSSSSEENTEKHYEFLLEWISRFGLTANRIELDRFVVSLDPSQPVQSSTSNGLKQLDSQEEYASFFNAIEQGWKSKHPQKSLMFKGTVQVLKDLCAFTPKEKWEEVSRSPTRSSATAVCFAKIKQELERITQEEVKGSFQDTVSRLEQVHADLTSLLEIFSPFSQADFRDAFRHHLSSIPPDLQPLTGFTIHSSAMTSLGGIFKAVERTLGRSPRILYGENSYFECIHATERVAKHATPIQEAGEEEWKDVDLILAQFNPTVKRINSKVTEYQATEYHVEKIAEVLHKALRVREGRSLSVAVDCTLDFSDSPRVGRLLAEFQKEIERGDLNLIFYRSGLKFDLFGMDNYCGAPFFMVHNRDSKWSFFDGLLKDPVLVTDHLSVNWFSLAYQHAAPYLEQYRKQIFDNTRAVLNRIPASFYHQNNRKYRVIPVDPDADPTFIDIKIFGPMHAFRGELLVGVFLTIKSMQAGYPLLFRPGIGFTHPNLAVLFGKECTTVRLTVGLDPGQIDVMVRCMETIDALNGPSEDRSDDITI